MKQQIELKNFEKGYSASDFV